MADIVATTNKYCSISHICLSFLLQEIFCLFIKLIKKLKKKQTQFDHDK